VYRGLALLPNPTRRLLAVVFWMASAVLVLPTDRDTQGHYARLSGFIDELTAR